MAVDYLSALNVGSGLNVTQIVDALVDAEKAPREATLNTKIEEKTVSISAFAEIKKEFDALKSSLTTLGNLSVINVNATGPEGVSNVVKATVTDPSLVEPFNYNIRVTSLAKPQTVSFGGYNSASASLDASNLTIDLGSWASDNSGNHTFTNNAAISTKTISLDNTDDLTSVKDKINQLDIGITASIIMTSEGNYSLALRSALGTQNQIRIQATSTTNSISNLSFDPEANGSGASNGGDIQKQAVAASDASFNFNGLALTRSSNSISDVIAGLKLDLLATSATDQRLTSSYDETLSLDAMKLFVEELNTVTKNLIDMSKTSLDEEDRGPLAGDTLVRAYRNRLRMITTTPIEGYGADPIYLSNFGVMTERDGTLSLNETKFKAYFAANPDEFNALTKSTVNSSNLAVTAEMTGKSWTPGQYSFTSAVKSATSILSANEASAQSFKSVDTLIGSGDGQLSDSLQSYAIANPGGQWSVSGNDRSLISIDNNGTVTITGGTNYENKNTYSFNVEYTINSDEKFTEAVTLNVNNLVERQYRLTGANIPTSVSPGDTFSVTVDGQVITTPPISGLGDNAYSLEKLVVDLNQANLTADGTFSADSGNILFTYNDAASVQSTALTTGLIYTPGSVSGTVAELTSGSISNRTVSFFDNQGEIDGSIINGIEGDIFKINIGSGFVSYSLTSDDVASIGQLGSTTARISYLAGKFDIAANTAASGSDIGVSFTEVNGVFTATYNNAGTAPNGELVSQILHSSDNGLSFNSKGALISDLPGTSIQEVVRISSLSIPVIVDGDKVSITLDNNGNNLTITSAALSSGDSLTEIRDALNTSHAGAVGTFSISNSDLIFTYNHNTGSITNSNDSNLIFSPAPGSDNKVFGTSSEQVAGSVTARSVDFLSTNEIDATFNSIKATDIFKIDIQSGGNNYTVSHTFTQSDVDAIAPLASAARLSYLASKLDAAADTAASGLDVGIDFSEVSGSLVGTATIAGTANNSDIVSQLKFSADSGSSFSDLGSGNTDTPGTSTQEVVKITSPGIPTIASGDKFTVKLDNNGSLVTVTTSALAAGADLNDVKDALNLVHSGASGVFSVSGSDLLFTYNNNSGAIANFSDSGLIYIPAPGTISQVSAGVDRPALSTVTEVSHTAGTTSAKLDGVNMPLENGVFKISSGGAKGINVKANGNHNATIYVGRSLFDSLKDFSDSVLLTNGDLDKKVARYNTDITDYKDQLTELETRMENERARYVEQFTAMETAVASFKETRSLMENMMESWKASLD